MVSASLMLTAPHSSRRATRSPRSVSPVQTVADSPYLESLASRMASSSSATLTTGSVGPKVSSAMQVIVGCDVGEHRRLEEGAHSGGLTAGEHLGAGGDGLADVAFDDVALGGGGHRAGVVGEAGVGLAALLQHC